MATSILPESSESRLLVVKGREFVISDAQPSDADAVFKLLNTSYDCELGDTGVHFKNGPRVNEFSEIETLIHQFLIVRTKGETRLEACIRITPEFASGCIFLGMFAVHDDFKGNGLGSAFLARVEEWSWSAKNEKSVEWVESIDLHVINWRTELLSFYARRGYRVVGSASWPAEVKVGLSRPVSFSHMRKNRNNNNDNSAESLSSNPFISKLALEHLRPCSDETILVMGCGSFEVKSPTNDIDSTLAIRVANAVGPQKGCVVGWDWRENRITRCFQTLQRQFLQQAGGSVPAQEGAVPGRALVQYVWLREEGLEKMPDRAYDAILMCQVDAAVPKTVLQTAHRLLKPLGRLVIVNIDYSTISWEGVDAKNGNIVADDLACRKFCEHIGQIGFLSSLLSRSARSLLPTLSFKNIQVDKKLISADSIRDFPLPDSLEDIESNLKQSLGANEFERVHRLIHDSPPRTQSVTAVATILQAYK